MALVYIKELFTIVNVNVNNNLITGVNRNKTWMCVINLVYLQLPVFNLFRSKYNAVQLHCIFIFKIAREETKLFPWLAYHFS